MKIASCCRWGLSLLFFMVAVFVFSPVMAQLDAGDTVTVIATGRGASKQAALQDARRNAVEKGIGVLVESFSTSVNSTIENDSINTSSKGYVNSYKELSYTKHANGVFEVAIEAVVSTKEMRSRLALQQLKGKRVMTILKPRSAEQIDLCKSSIGRAVEGSVNSFFAANGLETVDKETADFISNMLSMKELVNANDDVLAQLALKYNAELLLVTSIDFIELHVDDPDWDQRNITVTVKALDASTARFITQRMSTHRVVYEKGQDLRYADNKTAQKSIEISKAVAEVVFADVVDNFKEVASQGRCLTMLFRNFSEGEHMKIYSTLKRLDGLNDIQLRQEAPKYFEVGVKCKGKSMDLKIQLHDMLDEEGVYLSTQQSQGNRFLFYKRGTSNPY